MGKNKQYSQNTNDGSWNGQNTFGGQQAQNAFNGQPDAGAWPQQQGFDNGYNAGFGQPWNNNGFNPNAFNPNGFNGQAGFSGQQGFANPQPFNGQNGFNGGFAPNGNFNPNGFSGQPAFNGQQGFNGQPGFNGQQPAQGFNPQAFNQQAFNQTGGHSAWQSLGLSGLFGGNRQTEQFILGLLLGGAAAYVLGDPEKRAKLIRMAMKLYAGVAGSVEEFKEQIADLKAEVAAEQESGDE